MFAALLALIPAAESAPRRNEKIYAAVEADRAGAIALWQQIVDIDSGTGDVAGGTKIQALLGEKLKALGAVVRSEAAEAPGLPDNLVAVWHGTGKGRILVIAHIDTVFGPGTVAKRPFHIAGDRVLGPGVGDEKGGVVTAITALKILHDTSFSDFATITLACGNQRGTRFDRHDGSDQDTRESARRGIQHGARRRARPADGVAQGLQQHPYPL